MKYRIEVRGRRGDHEPYRYIEHELVKPGKAQGIVDRTALAIAAHELGSGGAIPRFDFHEDSHEDIHPVTVTIYEYDLEFHVSAVPVPLARIS